MHRVAVHGLGYIGLPTAALLAARGVRVAGVDLSPRVREALGAGQAPIAEPGLDALLAAALHAECLTIHATPVPAEFHVIAVPTPLDAAHRPMMEHVWQAGAALAPVLRRGDAVILESTSPVGTTRELAARLVALRPDLAIPGDVAIAHGPERVLPGRILDELVANDRVIGGLTPACTERAAGFYAGFVSGALHRTTAETAEFVKLAENSFRDVNIAFANELSMIASRHGIDVREAIALANRHPRVVILAPGPGVGGHCIAVDPWFLVAGAPEEARLIRAAREVNGHKTEWTYARIASLAIQYPQAPITCFGLAYKPDVCDLRESPALAIAGRLSAAFPGRVAVVEPHIGEAPEGLRLIPLDAAMKRDGIRVLLVRHAAFGDLAAADRILFDAFA
jgi:UDP-N-acetyl-D-mannosaminuronic acid dehydrogenase